MRRRGGPPLRYDSRCETDYWENDGSIEVRRCLLDSCCDIMFRDGVWMCVSGLNCVWFKLMLMSMHVGHPDDNSVWCGLMGGSGER